MTLSAEQSARLMPHASLIDINDLPLRHESLDRVWAVNGYHELILDRVAGTRVAGSQISLGRPGSPRSGRHESGV